MRNKKERKSMRKIIYFFVITLLLSSCINNGNMENNGIVEDNLGDKSSNKQTKDPSEQRPDNESDDNKDVFYQIKDKIQPETIVNLPYTLYNHADIVDDDLFIPVNKTTDIYMDSIIKYNFKSHETEVVFESPIPNPFINWLQVNHDWMIFEHSTDFGANSEIYTINMKSGEKKIIYEGDENEPEIFAPQLYDKYVAYVRSNTDEDKEVILYNLDNDQDEVIGKIHIPSFLNNFVGIKDDSLIWTDTIDDIGYYNIYDLQNKQLDSYEIQSNGHWPGYAKILNNKIYSLIFNDPENWAEEFGYFDIDSQEFVSLDLDNEEISQFLLGENELIIKFQDDKVVIVDEALEAIEIDIKRFVDENGVTTPIGIDTTYSNQLIVRTENEARELVLQIFDY